MMTPAMRVAVLLVAAVSVDASELVCRPLPGISFGAQCEGDMRTIASSQPLRSQLLQAFVQHGMLLWRDQQLSLDDEVAFMELLPWDPHASPRYGPVGTQGLERAKYMRWRVPSHLDVLLQGEGEVQEHHGLSGNLSSGKAAMEWHSDGVHEQEAPSVATSMYSLSLKQRGGDTCFASGKQIYQGLPPDSRHRARGMTVHYRRVPSPMAANGTRATTDVVTASESEARALGPLYSQVAKMAKDPAGVRTTSAPLVWRIPESGVESVVVSPMWLDHITEARPGGGATTLSWQQSQQFVGSMLDRFLSSSPGQAQYCHRWRLRDFVVWDNRHVLHSATPNNGFSQAGLRLLHRIRFVGPSRPQAAEEAAPTARQSDEI